MCVPFLGDHIVCIVVVSWVLCLLRQVAGCAMDELDLVGLVSLILGLMVEMVVLVVLLCLYSHVLFFHPPSSSLSSADRFLDCSFTLSFSLGFRIASLAVFERLSAFFARKA